MLFKLSNLNSNLALTLGYLNPALNNSALVKNRIHSPNSKIHSPQAIGHYFLWTLPSLGPSSAVGKKGKKRGQIGEILASKASLVVACGGGKGGGALRHPFPSPDYLSTSLFPPMQSLVLGYSIPSLGVMIMVKLGVRQYCVLPLKWV